MDNQTAQTTIIPTAGYISKPEGKKPHNRKRAIIVAAAIASAVLIVAAAIIITVFISQQPTNTTTTTSRSAATPTEPTRTPEPGQPIGIEKDATYRSILEKATIILSSGTIPTSKGRSFSADSYYLGDTPSDHLSRLGVNDKMVIVVTIDHTLKDAWLSQQAIATLGPNSCQLLFSKSNCKTITNTEDANKYRIINQTGASLKTRYRQLFGQIDTLPQRLSDNCPYHYYIPEIDRYVYKATCPKKDSSHLRFYQHGYQTSNDEAYIYFAGGSAVLDPQTNKYTQIYKDIDATDFMKFVQNENSFKINEDNYATFAHYRLTFAKDDSGSYIFQQFTSLK